MKRFLQIIVFLAAVTSTVSVGGGRSATPAPAGCQVSRNSGSIAPATDKLHDDARAISTLVKMGVAMDRDDLGRVRWIEAIHGEMNDEAMGRLPGLPMLEWLEIGGGAVTAAGMTHLKACVTMRRLYVHDVHLDDGVLATLAGLRQLEALSLQRTGISGKGLKHLKTIGTLNVLNLSGNEITDEDLAQVAGMKNLEVLALEDTKVTGAGLVNLEGMARLNVLNLTSCRIADEDLKHFVSIPNLRIVYAAGSKFGSKAIEELKEKSPMLSIFS